MLEEKPPSPENAIPKPAPTKKWKLDTDKIVAYSAMFISLVALLISVYEANLMRKHQYASVWPYIDHAMSYNGKEFNYHVVNNGVGPAIIHSITYYIDDKPTRDLDDFLSKILEVEADSLDYSYATIKGRVMPAKERTFAYEILDYKQARKLRDTQGRRWHVEICYCSVYGDCWKTYGFGDPRPCRSCK